MAKLNRKVRIIGSIDHDAYAAFAERMDELEAESGKPIDIELCSDGGDSYVGLAFYSRIRSSPCCTTLTVRGQAMSAAAIIVLAATHRIMDKDSWLMVHDDTYPLKGTDRGVLAVECQHHEDLERHWADIFLKHTSGFIGTDWRSMSKSTTYLRANDCLALGIIDEVL